jgi:antitoxin MazE
METRVQKWGNSLAVRIPRALAEELGLTENVPVHLLLRDKELVIVPVHSPALSLEALLEQVTETIRHGEVYTGAPVGGEAW